MKQISILALLMVFGIPFVMMTDLFPFHRYGMFARIPESKNEVFQYAIEVKENGKPWEKLKTGNEYIDKNYLPLLSFKSVSGNAQYADLGEKIWKSLGEKPDSIRIIKSVQHTEKQVFTIYPK